MTEVERIFHEALDQPLEMRESFVRNACQGKIVLAAKVLSLLSQGGSPTDRLSAHVAAAAADLLTPTGLDAGAMLGPYRVERKLGEGGMGAVYAASDTRLGRTVALKVIGRRAALAPGALERFQREARSAAALAHPHIAVLYDFGETASGPWLAMELVEGPSLRQCLANGPLAEPVARRLAAQLAAALDHAHSRGIVHCDLKPENLLLNSSGDLKVIDFGIAAAVGATGLQLGTAAYAAPELLAGKPVTARADIYSAGVVLFEMLRGQRPDPATGAACSPPLSPPVADLVGRCLAADPSARFRDGAHLAAALASLPPSGQPPMLAVLDFENLSADPTLAWLSAGIAETLSSRLAALSSIRVASRRRIRQAAAQDGPALPAQAARALGVRWIVEGSYQSSGDTVRVTVQVLDVTSGTGLYAGAEDGRWAELFAVQDRVAEAVARIVAGKDSLPAPAGPAPDLAAYEEYTLGRQKMNRMGPADLATAIQHFELAVAREPGYAICHSALGTAHILRFLHTSDPEAVRQSTRHLERAIALDPELGEPYPWMSFAKVRQNDAPSAMKLARIGVERQPDLPETQYFSGGLQYMLAESPLSNLAAGAQQLAEAIRLQPRFHPAWLILGATAAFAGRHSEAVRLFEEHIRLRNAPDLLYFFVGGHLFRATAWMRSGDWIRGREGFAEAVEVLKNGPPHLYRECFLILAACGLGDIALRLDDDPAAALAHYRHGWRLLQENPRVAGGARLRIRLEAGLAAAYAASGDSARARDLYQEGAGQIPTVAAHISTVTIECGLGQLQLALAVAALRLDDRAAAVAHLEQARAARWQDVAWLRVDPELSPLRTERAFVEWIESLEAAPALPYVPLPPSLA